MAPSSSPSSTGTTTAECYLPLLAFLTFDDEAEQYLCAAVLRPGNVPATQGAVGVLRRLLALLRIDLSPGALSGAARRRGFATPEIFDVLDAEYFDSTTWWPWRKTPCWCGTLNRPWRPPEPRARRAGRPSMSIPMPRLCCRARGARSAASSSKPRSSSSPCRAPQDNPRFVITNLRQTPRFIYRADLLCARRHRESVSRNSTTGSRSAGRAAVAFWANQLRVLLTAAAYVLMQELRLRAARTACARTQVPWLRDRLLKRGVV